MGNNFKKILQLDLNLKPCRALKKQQHLYTSMSNIKLEAYFKAYFIGGLKHGNINYKYFKCRY